MLENIFITTDEKLFNLTELEENNNITFLISSTSFGVGDKILGNILMEKYLEKLSTLEFLPKTIILCNEAVFLLLSSSKTYIYFYNLYKRNVDILVCYESLKYYNIEDKINIGRLTNVEEIIELQMRATKFISI